MIETQAHGFTHLRLLNESYAMNTNMTGIRCFSKTFASKSFSSKVCFCLKERLCQNCQVDFGHCEHYWVKMALERVVQGKTR